MAVLSNQCNFGLMRQRRGRQERDLVRGVSMAKVEIALVSSPRRKDQGKVIRLDEGSYQKLMDKSLD